MNSGLYFLLISLAFDFRSSSLDCYVCHSRQNPECGDPFPKNGNSSGSVFLYECDRVRKVGEGLLATSNALGAALPSYTPLEVGSYRCYKITLGKHAVRGCGKADFCTNITGACDLCGQDACNKAVGTSTIPWAFLIIIESLSVTIAIF